MYFKLLSELRKIPCAKIVWKVSKHANQANSRLRYLPKNSANLATSNLRFNFFFNDLRVLRYLRVL